MKSYFNKSNRKVQKIQNICILVGGGSIQEVTNTLDDCTVNSLQLNLKHDSLSIRRKISDMFFPFIYYSYYLTPYFSLFS